MSDVVDCEGFECPEEDTLSNGTRPDTTDDPLYLVFSFSFLWRLSER